MRIVFWQNCLSPHQLPYMIHLLEDERVDSVIIVVPCDTNSERKQMGWDVSAYTKLDRYKILISPDAQTIKHLFKDRQEESYHLFSGIRGFQFVFDAFRESMNYPIKRGLITERPNTFAYRYANAKPLWLHRIRFLLQDRQFIPYVNFVFAIGEEAVNYFRALSTKWTVFPFAYCTEKVEQSTNIHSLSKQADTKFIFIGSLSYWKAVDSILRANQLLKEKKKIDQEITLVGDGPERKVLEEMTCKENSQNVHFIGTRNNSEIPKLLEKQDVLILPSVYDGWGAVINEALQQGLYVICSDKCGAKELLTDNRCGSVFHGGNNKELANQMQYCIEHIEEIRSNRSIRYEWATQHISGTVIAKYMVDCLTGIKNERPWTK